jgi:hypothetical protein
LTVHWWVLVHSGRVLDLQLPVPIDFLGFQIVEGSGH